MSLALRAPAALVLLAMASVMAGSLCAQPPAAQGAAVPDGVPPVPGSAHRFLTRDEFGTVEWEGSVIAPDAEIPELLD